MSNITKKSTDQLAILGRHQAWCVFVGVCFGPIIRETQQNGYVHTWGSELILLHTHFGADPLYDATPLANSEPGVESWHVICVPRMMNPRKLGPSPVARDWLTDSRAKAFDSEAEARAYWENLEVRCSI